MMSVDMPRCPDCNGYLENRTFQEGGFMEGKPAEFTHDWWCPACYLRWLSVKGEPVEVEEEKAKEPEIVQCSCGETFDWEHWDRKTWPMPNGIHESVRHLDMGHTLMTPKKAEG